MVNIDCHDVYKMVIKICLLICAGVGLFFACDYFFTLKFKQLILENNIYSKAYIDSHLKQFAKRCC